MISSAEGLAEAEAHHDLRLATSLLTLDRSGGVLLLDAAVEAGLLEVLTKILGVSG
jgi:hypothetical protein